MKIFSFLFAVIMICVFNMIGLEAHLVKDKMNSFFQSYDNTSLPPIVLKNDVLEKISSDDITILDLIVPSHMQISDLVDCILYADLDVVHLSNVFSRDVPDLYEMLGQTYHQFVYVPDGEKGFFIASKYALSQAELTMQSQDNSPQKMLEFVIHGANGYYPCLANATQIQIVNNEEENMSIPAVLMEACGTVKMMSQKFSKAHSYQMHNCPSFREGFQILPVRHRGHDRDSGYSAEVQGGVSWGDGEVHWNGSVGVEAHDDRGNYAEMEARQSDKGGSVDVRAGHEE